MKKLLCLILLVVVLTINSYPVSGISAGAAVVINGDNGDILYSHNSDVRLPMASTTKIMTALVMLENCKNLDSEIVTTKEMVTVEGSSMGLIEGDRVSYRALLYGMLLSSGNDAANTAAIAISGSIEGFVELMNKRARDLELSNTNFVTPSGLDAEGHYTTAYELALVAREALKNPEFAKAASAKSATLCFGNPPYNRNISNHNRLLSMYDDIVGVKTGFTKKSGRCLVSAAKKDGKYVVAVTLNDGNDWADHRFLLDAGLGAIEVYEYKPKSESLSVPIVSGEKGFVKASVSAAEFSKPKGQSVTSITYLPHFLYAPVNSGEIIGNIEYYCFDRLVYKSNIISKGVKKTQDDMFNLIYENVRLILSFV
ncbi:MAG: D-alanyl-D-alanine carboxypeptidase [Clostridia bacterium]|nr:D-alanyl-D-alanine carboxypeptidase [Clostridia bacterium]